LSEFFNDRRVIRCEMLDATEPRPTITEALASKPAEKDIITLALSLFDAELEENGDNKV
jgi:hypothetical protein